LVDWKAPSVTGLGYLRFHILHSVRIRDEKVRFLINQFPRPKLGEGGNGGGGVVFFTGILILV